jgi:excisionase family DNA binding protein
VRATITIEEAAELLGVSRNTAYQHAAKDGRLAGVPVICVGRRKVLPRAQLLEILGIRETEADGEDEER